MLSAVEAILDPAALTLSLWLVSAGIEGELLPPYLILAVIVFSITFPGTSRLQFSIKRLIFDVLYSWFWVALLLFFLGFATGYIAEFSSQALITWLWVAPLSQIGAHLALRAAAPYLLMLQGPPQRAIIVGMNEQGAALASRIHETRYSRIELSGFFDDRDQSRLNQAENSQLLGRLRELPDFVKENRIQFIYLSLPMASQPRILQLLDELKDTTASIYFVPDMFVTDLIQGRSGTVCGMPVIAVCESPFTGSNGLIKRASDIVLSLLILMLISPLLLLIAIAIKLDSPGPVIFKQRRYGLDGEEILVYKFRSMRVCEDGETIRQAHKGDARITPHRRLPAQDLARRAAAVHQRAAGAHEHRRPAPACRGAQRNLPQADQGLHDPPQGQARHHRLGPGQRLPRRDRTLDKMQARIDHDLDYLRNWSLRLDLHIILKTIMVVFRDRAAY